MGNKYILIKNDYISIKKYIIVYKHFTTAIIYQVIHEEQY